MSETGEHCSPVPTNQDYLSFYIHQNEWKPTRPIGTIGAMSSSPGPAIVNLPTTIGEDQHDPTRAKAPGYKIGERLFTESSIGYGPGPGKYDIRDVTNKGKTTARATKFGTAKRFSDKIGGYEGSPGPAAYNRQAADKIVYPSAPTYSMPNAARGKIRDVTTPAPNAYYVPSTIGPGTGPLVKGPEYSFGKDKRMRDAKLAQNPGPAAYMLPPTNVNMSKAPAYSMGTKAKPPLYDPQTALYGQGPATYSTHLVKYNKYSTPRISFGIRHSPYKALPGFAAEKC